MDSKAKAHLWLQLHSEFKFQSENKTLNEVCKLAIDLMSTLPHFNWTSIYWLRDDILESFDYHKRKLTEHKDSIVNDVLHSDNNLTYSTESKAEIVVLIKDPKGKILGQINIDSDDVGAFNWLDRTNMEIMASKLAEQRLLSQTQSKIQA